MTDKKTVLTAMHGLAGYVDEALRGEGLTAHLVRAKRSYLAISYKLQLAGVNRSTLSAVGNLGPVLEQLSGLAPVRVSTRGGIISVEFPTPYPVSVSADAIAKHMRGANICLGFDNWSNPIYVQLKDRNAVAFIGIPGSGKSTALRAILYGIMATNPLKFMVLTVKGEEWQSFAKVQGCVGVYTRIEDIAQILADGVAHLEKLALAGQRSKPTLLVVDDMHAILKGNPQIVDSLGKLISVGRAVGFYALLSTVSWGSRDVSGGFAIEDSVAARLVFSTSSNVAAARATGRKASGVEQLSGMQGDALLITGSEQSRIATGYVTDAMIAKLPQSSKPIVVQRLETKPTQPKTEQSTPPVLQVEQPPLVQPPRLLTPAEQQQWMGYFDECKRSGKGLSQTKAIEAVFGKKYPKTIQLFKESLGEYGDSIKSDVRPPGRNKADPAGEKHPPVSA